MCAQWGKLCFGLNSSPNRTEYAEVDGYLKSSIAASGTRTRTRTRALPTPARGLHSASRWTNGRGRKEGKDGFEQGSSGAFFTRGSDETSYLFLYRFLKKRLKSGFFPEKKKIKCSIKGCIQLDAKRVRKKGPPSPTHQPQSNWSHEWRHWLAKWYRKWWVTGSVAGRLISSGDKSRVQTNKFNIQPYFYKAWKGGGGGFAKNRLMNFSLPCFLYPRAKFHNIHSEKDSFISEKQKCKTHVSKEKSSFPSRLFVCCQFHSPDDDFNETSLAGKNIIFFHVFLMNAKSWVSTRKPEFLKHCWACEHPLKLVCLGVGK